MTSTVTNPGQVATTRIGADGLRRAIEDGSPLCIVDVRTGGEYSSAHIPGSHNLPLDLFRQHTDRLIGLDRDVVLVCQSGARADQALEALLGGDSNVRAGVLHGGLDGWRAGGGEVTILQSPRWAMDRQVRLVAGGLVLLGMVAGLVVPRAKWLSAGVGAGLFYSAVSNTCAMANLLGRLPYNRGADCDVEAVLARLTQDESPNTDLAEA